MNNNSKIKSIPLNNLNCTHCKLYNVKRKECIEYGKEFIAAGGKKCSPEEYYCVYIFKNYKE